MVDEQLAGRVKRIRESLGLSISDAASRLGFSNYQTLSQIESGKRAIKASELVRFAKAYFCTISSLFDEEVAEQQVPLFLWRKSPSDEIKKSIEMRAQNLAEQCSWLENALGEKASEKIRFGITPDSISSNRQVDILARRTADYLGVGSRPAFTLKRILEDNFGVKIFYCDLSDKGSALSLVSEELGDVIVINSDEAPWRRNYDLAHELFHIITWDLYPWEQLVDSAFFDIIEKKADRFASTLLIPEEAIRSELDKKLKDGKITKADFIDLAREFQVSVQALAYRLFNLKTITFKHAQEIASDSELIALNRERRWKAEDVTPKSELLCDLALSALRKAIISRGKFAELCEIDRCDVDYYIERQGKLDKDGDSIEIMGS